MKKVILILLCVCWCHAAFAATTGVNIRAELLSESNDIISFRFSKSVFDKKKQMSFSNKPLVECDGLSGSFEFVSNRQLYFYVSADVIGSAPITCRPNLSYFKNISFSQDRVLVHPKPFGVRDLRIVSGGQFPTLRVEFNAPVSAKMLNQHLLIHDVKSGEPDSRLNYQISPMGNSTVFLITLAAHNPKADISVKLGRIRSVQDAKLKKEVQFRFAADERTDNEPIVDKPGMYSFTGESVSTKDGTFSLRIFMPDLKYWEKITNNNINKYIQVTPSVDFVVQNNSYQYVYENGKDRKYIDLKGNFEALTHYQILLRKGLQTGKLVLKKDAKLSVTTGTRYPAMKVTTNKPYVSNKKGHVDLETTNVGKVKVKVEKLLKQNYRYYVNFSGQTEQGFHRYSEVVLEKELMLENPANQFITNNFDLSRIMPKNASGIFRVTFYHHFTETNNVGRKVNRTLNASQMIFSSDLGVTAKAAKDQLFVSVLSLSRNKPVPGAKVVVYSENNKRLVTAKTDKNGIYVLNQRGFNSLNPQTVVVQSKQDRNFLKLTSRLIGTNPAVRMQVEDRYQMIGYMSRQLMRPGDEAAVLFILKDAEFKAVSKLPVEVTLRDPVNAQVLKKVIQTNENGLYDMRLKIPYGYKTGQYRLVMKVAGRIIGKSSFKVEEFIPNRIEVEAHADKAVYMGNDPLKVTLNSQYLFGAPAADLKSEVRFSAVSKSYQDKRYKGFSFTSDVDGKKSETDFISMTKHTRLDQDGKTTVILKNRTRVKPPSILKGLISGKVFDEGRPVSGYTDVDIYPYHQMVGLKRSHDGMAESGVPVTFRTALLKMSDKSTVTGQLKVDVKKLVWFRTYDRNSRWGYTWHKDYQQVQTFMATAGTSFDIRLEESGTYQVSATDLIGGHQSIVEHRVSGWSFDPVSPRDDMRNLDVIVDQKAFKPGESIQVQVKSPIPGRLLLTFEKDKVIEHHTVDMPENTASVKLKVPNIHGNGIYLSASVTRTTEKDDPLLPFRAFGSAYVSLDQSAHQIELSVSAPEMIEPKQPFDVHVASNAAEGSEVAVSIVDLGILQIISQKIPNLFEAFKRKPLLLVGLFDLYDQLSSHAVKGSVVNVGGDGVSAMKMNRMQKFLSNESIHQRVKPLSYWSGLVKLDENGEAVIPVTLPAFNGKARLSAVAVGKQAVGNVAKDMVIREKVVIKPTYPRFTRVGDKLTVPVRVFNKDKRDLFLQMQVTSPEGMIIQGAPERVQIAKGDNQLVSFSILPQKAGNGTVYIRLLDGPKQFEHVINLPIREKGSLTSRVFAGESRKTVPITVDDDFYRKGVSKAYVNISDSYLARYQGAFDRLVDYPYGCAEQRASKLLALLNMVPFINESVPESKSLLEQRTYYLNDGLVGLLRMQRYSGEFNYWENGLTFNPYVSVFAADVMFNAKIFGLDVPKYAMDRSLRLLKKNVNSGHYQKTLIPYYSAYLLSENGQLDSSVVNSMLDQKRYQNRFPSMVMLAAMLKNAGMTSAMNKVLSEVRQYDVTGICDRRTYGGDFYSRGRDLAFGLWVYCRYFGADDMASKWMRVLTGWFDNARYMSTQESAFMIRALNAYYNGMSPEALDVMVKLNGRSIHVTQKTGISDVLNKPTITMTPEKTNRHFNYAVEVTGFAERLVMKEQRDGAGFNLTTQLYKENGEQIDPSEVIQGSLLYAKVDVSAASPVENVVVAYELPSCLEPVNLRLDQLRKGDLFKDHQMKLDYRDIRDDKILSFLTAKKATTFYLPVRAVTAGECIVPATTAEAMYAPEMNDYSREFERITVIEVK